MTTHHGLIRLSLRNIIPAPLGRSTMNEISLNGPWKARWFDGQRGSMEFANRDQVDEARYIEAQVPGEIHLDLWRHGIIDDPYVGTNCLKARWVEECFWSYRGEFDAPEQAVRARAWLVFESLDLVATIVLNGQEIGRHRNVFYPCRIDVTGQLKPGRNVLTVHLDGGLFDAAEKPWKGYGNRPDALLHKRHWLRKPQCQFSWDWSTRLINVGITGSVRLEYTDQPARVDQFVPLVTLSEDLRQGSVLARLFVEGLSADEAPATLKVELPELGIEQSADVTIKPGLHPVELRVDVPNPQLWWPIGHGEPKRYELRVCLEVRGQVLHRQSCMIGFRHVKVVQDPHPEQGRYFYFQINGKPIFCKGANFVPADMIFARLDRARYEQLVDRAIEANFNFLRVWGGGLYESSDFFDICDARGILVWQEFIFACSKYPAHDQAFFDDVKWEAIHNLRRLARHPSLVAWCGNNEMEQGNWDWGYDQGVVHPDYAFFHLTLPRLLKAEDPTRYYQPSSPFSPDGEYPNADHVGDQHPWSVGFANTDFRDYRKMICRFPNEGGIIGPTSLPTMLACLPENQRYVHSFAWQTHDNSIDSWGEPSYLDGMVHQWLGCDARKMSIEEFTYRVGLLQGEGLREYIDNFRRRMFSSASAIFWMFNDCWPAVRSWTIVDYYLRRTPAFWAVKRAMQPVSVVLAEQQDRIAVYGINETAETIEADLIFGLFELAGGWPMRRQRRVSLPANASVELDSFPRSEWTDPARSMAFAKLTQGSKLLARNRLFLQLFKDMTFPTAQVTVKLTDGVAAFHSPTFAWGVCLDLSGQRSLPDNFFDLWPGESYSMAWTDDQPPQVLWVGNL